MRYVENNCRYRVGFCFCACCQYSLGDDQQGGVRSIDDPAGDVDISFENKNQKRQYERVLNRIQSMKPARDGQARSDDWFVVGSAFGEQVSFETFQGEKNVAIRVAQFVTETRNKGQWKIYSRAKDSKLAQEQLAKAKFNYRNWRQAEYNRLAANEIVRQNKNRNTFNQPYYGGRTFVTGVTIGPGWAGVGAVTSSFGTNSGMRSFTGMPGG